MRGEDADVLAVRRAARTVAFRVATIAAVLVALLVAGAALFVLQQSRPQELLEPPRPGEHRILVDAGEVLAVLIVVGILAVLLAGVASWRIARSAVDPLGRALASQRRFVADASHELRTPLTVLDARLQLLRRRLPADVLDDFDAVRDDARALNDVVTDLLADAEASAASLRSGEVVDLAEVVRRSVASLAVMADGAGVRLEADAADPAAVAAPEAALRRVVTALVDNAVAHTPGGGTVRVTTAVAGGRARLTVEDTGSGITGIAPEAVFDRFARSTATETPGHRGFGLGLSLVRETVLRHGGTVAVAATGPGGTTMRVELPLADRRHGAPR